MLAFVYMLNKQCFQLGQKSRGLRLRHTLCTSSSLHPPSMSHCFGGRSICCGSLSMLSITHPFDSRRFNCISTPSPVPATSIRIYMPMRPPTHTHVHQCADT